VREGASVVVADIDLEGAEAVALANGSSARAEQFDATDESTVAALVAATIDRYGHIDVLHNNAGIAFDDDTTVTRTDLAVWDRTFALNLRGYVAGCKHVIPYMLDTGGGSIINTASVAGLAGGLYHTAYGTLKGAIVSFTRFVATQYSGGNIRCNAIAPGPIATPGLQGSAGSDTLVPAVRRQLLTDRLGTPDDVALLATYLASDESGFVTGQVIQCDGGLTAHQPYVADLRDIGWE
jgi:NAD(P)-dependent dehydrogenase (short-subunit alcohol dehydrogenase family)